jgi:hypothetical protein
VSWWVSCVGCCFCFQCLRRQGALKASALGIVGLCSLLGLTLYSNRSTWKERPELFLTDEGIEQVFDSPEPETIRWEQIRWMKWRWSLGLSIHWTKSRGNERTLLRIAEREAAQICSKWRTAGKPTDPHTK